ncbi:MAG: carbamoyltransferase [Myxococcales bacterium]|nr:carbamoyltransferase [Myxococcales bacterium]
MRALGISAFYHDSAAALVVDGRVLAAVQEERFTRKRHDACFPEQSIRWVLEHSGTRLRDVEHVAFYEKPFIRFERLLETYLQFAPRGFGSFRAALPVWLRDKLFQKQELSSRLREIDEGFDPSRLLFAEHHRSHAASAFFVSPFEEAAVLTMDGVGEWATTTLGAGRGNQLSLTHEIHFPHSLGLLYSAFTAYAGFRVNSGEYKLMGLAPSGTPKYAELIYEHLIDLKDDGSFRLNLRYFDYCTGLSMTNESFHRLFGGPPRKPEDPLRERDADLAASVQAVVDEAVLRLARAAQRETGLDSLCLAGGVALNCVANGKLLRRGPFRSLFIQPAAGDAGGALGAALTAYHGMGGARACDGVTDGMGGALLGPAYSQDEIEARLRAVGACFEVLDEEALVLACAARLDDGAALGWFQGRMEFGPRALGARSILCDPRRPDAKDTLNAKIKLRESFRPFAPAVLCERTAEWFDLAGDSPYMLLVAKVAASRLGQIPAVTHVDGSARIQSVGADAEPRFRRLLQAFEQRTSCPILVNTSFNVRGEPIVRTPEEAFRCFMGTELDCLAVGCCLLDKDKQTVERDALHGARFDAD